MDRAYWVLFSAVAGVGPVRFQRLLEVCGDAESAWRAPDLRLAEAGLDRRAIAAMHRLRASTSPQAALERLRRLAITVLTLQDEGYPSALRLVPDPPFVLYVRGRFTEDDALGVALVGTRRATIYGRTVAEQFARDLALAGVTVVSGLAKGIDTVAHRATLDAGGRTVAVLGNGLDQVYPPENATLARRIVEEDAGAVVSEFAPGVPPDAVNFPRRNRIIAGLSAATVIVEAGQRSGALITADFALEQGREVFAVPGSILSPNSTGPNGLLKQGATPALSARDILDGLGIEQRLRATARDVPGLDPDERAVAGALGAEPRAVDEIARDLDRGAGDVAALLTILEIKGLARKIGSALYVRV